MTTSLEHWLNPPKKLIISSTNVHIWRINLNQTESQVAILKNTLSSDEIARSERFYFPQHRQRFITARGSLRSILGQYLQVDPMLVQFIYQHRGKPLLADKFADQKITFNISHSENLALCAVTCENLIGVDLEHIRPISDLENLAKRFFLNREYESIKSIPSTKQQETFFRYWTCKEAYLKATGDGLVKLEETEVNLTSDLISDQKSELLVTGSWTLKELNVADNFAGAVAVNASDVNWQFWKLG